MEPGRQTILVHFEAESVHFFTCIITYLYFYCTVWIKKWRRDAKIGSFLYCCKKSSESKHLWGVAPTSFWPWGNRPHGVGAYVHSYTQHWPTLIFISDSKPRRLDSSGSV